MTAAELQAEHDRLCAENQHDCNGAVANCPEATLYIKQANSFSPDRYGYWQYVPVCSRCFRTGAAVAEGKYCVSGKTEVRREQVTAWRESYRQQCEERWERIRLIRQQAEEAQEAEWQTRYEAHIQSPYWRAIAARVMARDRAVCQGCLSAEATRVHHLTYANLGAEFAFELTSLCKACHTRLHGREC